MGCKRPNSRIECTSSASASSSNTWRGWRGLGSMSAGEISRVHRTHLGRGRRRPTDQDIGGRIPHPRAKGRRTGVTLGGAGRDQRSQAPAEAALLA